MCSLAVISLILLSNSFLYAADPVATPPKVTYTLGLPAQDLRHLMQDHFQVSDRASAIPPAVLKEIRAHDYRLMKTLPGFQEYPIPDLETYPPVKMADAGKRFNSTDYIDPSLPGRRLSFLGVTPYYCVFSWETGGMTGHLVLAVFRLSKTASGEEQVTLIGAALPNHTVKNMEELKKKVEAGGYEAFDYTHYLLL